MNDQNQNLETTAVAVVSGRGRVTSSGQKLLKVEDRRNLGPLGSQDGSYLEAVAYVKFFGGGRWTWYATEYDGDDTFFGYVVSGLSADCDEFGYFTASELLALRFPPFGLGIERDIHFRPAKLSAILGAS